MNNGIPTVILAAGGQEVSTDSESWREECAARHRHVLNMRRLDRLQRHDYVANVRRREGDLAADRLAKAYGDDWERRKAEQQRAQDELNRRDPAGRP